MKYRKKPVVIEAFQWTGSKESTDFPSWFWDASKAGTLLFPDDSRVAIKTLKGVMVADKGDFIIRGVNGELYPCKPGIFRKIYELVK